MTATVTIVKDDSPGSGSGPEEPRRWIAWVVVVAALVVMVAGLITWRSAVTSEEGALAEDRDAALIDARRHIETLNTMDTTAPEAGLKKWQAASTGTLRDQLTQVSDKEVGWLGEQGTISVGKVVDAGILSLDGDTATVLAAVEVTVTSASKPSEEPTVKRSRFLADLVRVGGDWKLEALEPVQVGVDGGLQ